MEHNRSTPPVTNTDYGIDEDNDLPRPYQKSHPELGFELEDDENITITRATKVFSLCAALNSCNLGYDINRVNTSAAEFLQ